jgi:NAD(P)-dependent dehydrogenase (short-subunit alcohol dehydrogenase family)
LVSSAPAAPTVRKALIFGASGGLASALAEQYLERGSRVSLVTRSARRPQVEAQFSAALAEGTATLQVVHERYTEYNPATDPAAPYDAVYFTQALFQPTPLVEMSDDRIEAEILTGLTELIRLTRSLLLSHAPGQDARRDICFTGSTSSYVGFANTTVYCAIKHGLVGFVRALNEEYAQTNMRFWLFSMGSMDTEMGHNVPKQDRATFLQAPDVASRMVEAVEHPSNMFEPEVLIRRRTVRRTA